MPDYEIEKLDDYRWQIPRSGHMRVPARLYATEEMLEDAGYEVVAVRNAEAGLAVLGRGGIDLVVSDYRLPGKSGLELLERAQSLGSDVAVVIVTAQNTFENAVEAMKQGALDYLVKPFGTSEVSALVEKALRARSLERRACSRQSFRQRASVASSSRG